MYMYIYLYVYICVYIVTVVKPSLMEYMFFQLIVNLESHITVNKNKPKKTVRVRSPVVEPTIMGHLGMMSLECTHHISFLSQASDFVSTNYTITVLSPLPAMFLFQYLSITTRLFSACR